MKMTKTQIENEISSLKKEIDNLNNSEKNDEFFFFILDAFLSGMLDGFPKTRGL